MSAAPPTGYAARLPPVDPVTGFLPPGIHSCAWDEFVDVFVDQAPHPDHRRERLKALELHVDQLDALLPNSTLWLDGGFVSHKQTPPFDIDVLAVAENGAWEAMCLKLQAELQTVQQWVAAGQQGAAPKLPTYAAYGGMLTHQDATIAGVYYPRIQPFGGYLDSFIFPAAASEVLANFEEWWCLDFATDTPKGFVEVRPDGR